MMSCPADPVCHGSAAYARAMAGAGPHRESRETTGARSAAPDELRDSALHEEIELVGQLVVAATSTPHRLTQTEIDRVLGVEGERDDASAPQAREPG